MLEVIVIIKMFVHRLKKKLIELGEQEFVDNLENEHKRKQLANKKRKVKVLDYVPIRVAFKLAYVGVKYDGLESQITTKNTIEAELFKAFAALRMVENRDESNYNRAGRTDKGVSALGNVIAINIRKMGKSDSLNAEYLNRVLPEDIQILDEVIVDEKFNARYDCIKRVYKYYFYRGHYNLEAMTVAGQQYIGTHDYRNFCKLDVIANQSFVRTIMDVRLERVHYDQEPVKYALFEGDQRLEMYCVTIEGNAFLWHQIRYMMSVLFMIGKGDEDADLITALLNKTDGKPNYQLAPDYPLVLYDCQYKDQIFKNIKNTLLLQEIYERMREQLSVQYIQFLHLYQMGLVSKGLPILPQKPRTKPHKPIIEQRKGVTVDGAINSLKGKRKEKYDIKIQKVNEYQQRQQ